MSGFHRQRLQQLRSAAGLGEPAQPYDRVRYTEPRTPLPMPSFYVPGMRLPGDKDSDYIDVRYFSPAALRWADAVVDYRRNGGALSADDEECFGRVWEAMRRGRAPTDSQLREDRKDQKWHCAERQIPRLYEIEMRRRGYKHYGPDYELPEGAKGPGSSDELIYKYLYRDLGYASPTSAKARHNEWKRGRDGTN